MKIFSAVIVVALLLSNGGVWADEALSEAEAQARLEGQGYRSVRIISIRGSEVQFEFMDEQSIIRTDSVRLSKFHRLDNLAPEEGGRYWKSPLVSQLRDAYSLKRPAGKTTVAVAAIPASLPKFSKGATWGVVAVSPRSGKIVRGKITPAGPDQNNGHQPAVIVFEEPVGTGSKILAADRWWDNRLFGRKRGELVVWNPATASWKKLVSGTWLERDPAHMALIAETYGVDLEQVQHAEVTATEAEQVPKKLGFKKVASPDGVRYTPLELAIFKKLYAKPSLVRWHQRFLNNGGLAIGVPPEPIGAALNVGVAALTATFDTRHNVPCLSTLLGGMSRFERDQRFYKAGNVLTVREFERTKVGGSAANRRIVAAGQGSPRALAARRTEVAGQAGIEEILAQVQSSSPTGCTQAYDWPGFWLEPKRVEFPSGGGVFRSPNLDTEYTFSNTYLHLFGGEVAENATLHWGPSYKIDHWKYLTSSGYRGRGHFYGLGASAELVARHKWGGSDSRFAFWYGYDQLDRGRFHQERRHPWVFEWQTELWWRGLPLGKDGRGGNLLSGAKMGVLAKTNDFLLAWAFPVLYRAPHDIFKVSVGPQFLHFFSRDGNEPKGGGVGVQAELLDGMGYRFSYFPFKKGMYHTGWIDPYRVYMKLRELQAERGIYEIPWDPYVPKAVSAAVAVAPPPQPQSTVKEIRPSPPAVPCAEKAEVKKYKAKAKRAVKKKREVKKEVAPAEPEKSLIPPKEKEKEFPKSPPFDPERDLRECRRTKKSKKSPL